MLLQIRPLHLEQKNGMTKLSVNLNKIALLRNTRTIGIPSVTKAAQICLNAGVHGITVHPRPDQRHIRPADVYELAEMLTVEFNIEGNPYFSEFMEIVRKAKPTQCTLVPDAPNAFTSDHGWNLVEHGQRLAPIIQELKELGIRISLFMDPDSVQIERAKEIGADRIELYTEPYATAYRNQTDVEAVWQQFAQAAKHAQEIGLGVNAGHDLNLQNLAKFCSIPGIFEVSIGHALIAEALEMGLFNTVQAYLKILS
jgi:pyridoxine 5-phosphate synthase